jgi:CRP-like cAMP-binding protein
MVRVAPRAETANKLLARLPAKDRARLLARCEEVELSFPEVLAEPGQSVRHVYFPTEGFISLVTPMGGRVSLEVALAGNEGMYGVGIALGVGISPVHALVQGSGKAWRMDASAFRRELAKSTALRGEVHRYIYVLMSQLVQTAGCNRFHVVEERLARWLLMTSDRAHSSAFRITHEFLAYMLGVRRVGITEAASELQRQKLIKYTRGAMSILDRKGLERASCPCYESDLSTYEQILGERP